MTIGESLRRFRQEFHLTRKAVADTLGIKPQSYIYEKAGVIPSSQVIVKLAKAYGVSADYLLGLSDIPTPARTVDEVTQAAITFANVLKKNFAQQTTEGTGDHEIKTDAPARL